MASFYLSPFSTFLQLFNNNGVPLNGGLCWTYLAGTSNPGSTYTDQSGLVPNSNPIQMDSNGRLQNAAIWQQGGVPLKFIFTTNAGTTLNPIAGTQLGPTFDQISGINDPALSSFVSQIQGSFTGTGVGFSGSPPTYAITYSITGTVVTVTIPAVSGTSNSTTFGISGVPAAIQPPTLAPQHVAIPQLLVDNGVIFQQPCWVSIPALSGTWSLGSANANFTASGQKGTNNQLTFTYLFI
jgi:hypothetical protein